MVSAKKTASHAPAALIFPASAPERLQIFDAVLRLPLLLHPLPKPANPPVEMVSAKKTASHAQAAPTSATSAPIPPPTSGAAHRLPLRPLPKPANPPAAAAGHAKKTPLPAPAAPTSAICARTPRPTSGAVRPPPRTRPANPPAPAAGSAKTTASPAPAARTCRGYAPAGMRCAVVRPSRRRWAAVRCGGIGSGSELLPVNVICYEREWGKLFESRRYNIPIQSPRLHLLYHKKKKSFTRPPL